MPTVSSANPPTGSVSARAHFRFLDGIRGLAALFVAFGHICGAVGCPPPRSISTAIVFSAFRFSGLTHAAVCAFIVLSGFCLMMPVANSTERRLAGGVGGFFRRRARRILPPYYAALALAFLLPALRILAANVLKGSHYSIMAGWSLGNVVSHLFLVHNLRHDWYVAWDGPTWTVATEWQIYFLFAVLLLPIWRRLGIAACFVSAAVLGLAPHFFMPRSMNLDWAAPWLLGLFAIGMLGALIAVSPDDTWARLRARIPWRTVTIVSAIVIDPFYVLLLDRDAAKYYWFVDFLAAVPILSLILWCSGVATQDSRARPAVLKILESRWIQLLGAFSYSLYLVHWPIEQLIDQFLQPRLTGHPGLHFAILFAAGFPLALGCAYLFHLVFERPFLRLSKPSRIS